jgi:hypothetical protein
MLGRLSSPLRETRSELRCLGDVKGAGQVRVQMSSIRSVGWVTGTPFVQPVSYYEKR